MSMKYNVFKICSASIRSMFVKKFSYLKEKILDTICRNESVRMVREQVFSIFTDD